MLMWTDSPTSWWSSIVKFFMKSNPSATSTVLEARPGGDVDLHIVLWFVTSATWWWALRQTRNVFYACLALFAWASLVETMQPWFTEIRDRQIGDYFGNGIGIALVAGAVLARWRYFDGPMSPAT